MTGSNRPGGRRATALARLVLPVATMLVALGCGASTGSTAPSAPAPTPVPTTAPASGDGAGASDAGGGPIGGDIGDRTKGSVKAQVSGDLTASIDLPFAPGAARLAVDGPNTGYLPFTDPTNGTLFLTIADSGLLIQYAGPDNVALTNGAQPCELHLDSLDASGAKGSFTCKGMLLVRADAIGSADMTGTFEGHQ